MKINEIFTPGRFPTWTYVDSHLRQKQQQFKDVLNDGSLLISISGPSKSGKTVFVEHILGKENLIQITGAGVTAAIDVWIKVFDIVGTPVSRSTTSSTSSSSTFDATTAVEAGVVLLKGKGSLSGSMGRATQEATSESEAVDALQLLIKELAGTDLVVFIDDFHYIPQNVQVAFAQQLKEAMRNGVKFICASVPYHSDDVIRSNPDLRGRIFSIDFDYWGADVLQEIAYKGFGKANMSCDHHIVENLAAESAGSPQLMQYLCLNACYEVGMREVPTSPFRIDHSQGLFEAVCKRTVLSTDYGSVVDKMIEGPKTRGEDRKVHMSIIGWQGDVYKFLLKALSLDPPQLNFRYQPLVDRVASLCHGSAPSGSSITSACYHAAAIANDAAGDNIVEWDGENDVFDIRDPYLLFYIRWSDAIAP